MRTVSITLMFCSSLLLGGCGPTHKQVEAPRVNRIAHRQSPPEPVYNRLSWVAPPEIMPAREIRFADDRPRILPVFHLELKDNTLKEAAAVLAATARYGSYCSSFVADRRITINSLGTIDELAASIEQQVPVRVIVDHLNREVRFLEDRKEPKFVEGGGDLS